MNAMMSIDFLLTDKSGGFHVNTNRRHIDSHGITMMKLTHYAGFASTHLPQPRLIVVSGLTVLRMAQSAPFTLPM